MYRRFLADCEKIRQRKLRENAQQNAHESSSNLTDDVKNIDSATASVSTLPEKVSNDLAASVFTLPENVSKSDRSISNIVIPSKLEHKKMERLPYKTSRNKNTNCILESNYQDPIAVLKGLNTCVRFSTHHEHAMGNRRFFSVTAVVGIKSYEGKGRSKREARINAAREALKALLPSISSQTNTSELELSDPYKESTSQTTNIGIQTVASLESESLILGDGNEKNVNAEMYPNKIVVSFDNDKASVSNNFGDRSDSRVIEVIRQSQDFAKMNLKENVQQNVHERFSNMTEDVKSNNSGPVSVSTLPVSKSESISNIDSTSHLEHKKMDSHTFRTSQNKNNNCILESNYQDPIAVLKGLNICVRFTTSYEHAMGNRRFFRVSAVVGNKSYEGKGRSKREARINAAREALKALLPSISSQTNKSESELSDSYKETTSQTTNIGIKTVDSLESESLILDDGNEKNVNERINPEEVIVSIRNDTSFSTNLGDRSESRVVEINKRSKDIVKIEPKRTTNLVEEKLESHGTGGRLQLLATNNISVNGNEVLKVDSNCSSSSLLRESSVALGVHKSNIKTSTAEVFPTSYKQGPLSTVQHVENDVSSTTLNLNQFHEDYCLGNDKKNITGSETKTNAPSEASYEFMSPPSDINSSNSTVVTENVHNSTHHKIIQKFSKELSTDTAVAVNVDVLNSNPISALNEVKGVLSYSLVEKTGPPHDPTFKVCVTIDGIIYFGEGKSFKMAKFECAKTALKTVIESTKIRNARNHGHNTKITNSKRSSFRKKSQTDPEENPISFLNEWRGNVFYNVDKESGPSHRPTFEVSVAVDGNFFQGLGHSLKSAKMDAARNAIEWLFRDSTKINAKSPS